LKNVATLTLLILTVACGTAPPPVTDITPAAVSEKQRLATVLDAYFEEQLELNPILASSIGDTRYNHVLTVGISESFRQKAKAVDEKYLALISAIDSSKLDGQDRLSYQIFRRDLEESLEGYRYPSQLIPLNQFFSTPNFFAQLGSGSSLHPFRTVDDYEDFLGRVNGFVEWVDVAIANMRDGMRQGIVQPRIIMEKTLPQLEAHLVEDPEKSLFYQPIRNFPVSFTADEKTRLTGLYRQTILEKIVPAYRRLHTFVKNDYLPATRATAGMHELPAGGDWYRYLVKVTTTTDLTPDRIHQIGLAEVQRIHGEMRNIMVRVGFQGTLKEFFDFIKANPDLYFESREDLLASYRTLKSSVDASTSKLFDLKPKSDYEIRPVEEFREKSQASGSYQAAPPDGSRPGVFYVNTYDLKARPKTAMTSLLLHEGSPGHHFQIMIQRELEELPRFRRFGGYGAYIEGWGLYAESLGEDLGMFEDPYQHYGALEAELWRSIRLVLDTGIHGKGWTREQAIEYARQNSAVDDTRIISEVERFMAIPSQALAYKIGQLKIAELRAKAERELGAKFDVKAFHREILIDGALPLDVLEWKITQWINATKG
jgi:uncharacterized protein (DUF885 family)